MDSQKQISVRVIKPENLGDRDRKLYIFIFRSKVFIQISSESHREWERKKEWVCGVSDSFGAEHTAGRVVFFCLGAYSDTVHSASIAVLQSFLKTERQRRSISEEFFMGLLVVWPGLMALYPHYRQENFPPSLILAFFFLHASRKLVQSQQWKSILCCII